MLEIFSLVCHLSFYLCLWYLCHIEALDLYSVKSIRFLLGTSEFHILICQASWKDFKQSGDEVRFVTGKGHLIPTVWRVRGGRRGRLQARGQGGSWELCAGVGWGKFRRRWVWEILMNWLSMVMGCEGKRGKEKGLWSDAWVFGWGQHSWCHHHPGGGGTGLRREVHGVAHECSPCRVYVYTWTQACPHVHA